MNEQTYTEKLLKNIKSYPESTLVELMAQKENSVPVIAARLEVKRRENVTLKKRANRAFIVSIIAIIVSIVSLGLPYLGFDIKAISGRAENAAESIVGEYRGSFLNAQFSYDLRKDQSLILRGVSGDDYIQFTGTWSKWDGTNRILVDFNDSVGTSEGLNSLSGGVSDTLTIEGDDLISEKFQTRFQRVE